MQKLTILTILFILTTGTAYAHEPPFKIEETKGPSGWTFWYHFDKKHTPKLDTGRWIEKTPSIQTQKDAQVVADKQFDDIEKSPLYK